MFIPKGTQDNVYHQVYINKTVPDPTKKPATNPNSAVFIHNTTLFALGILLIEICLGRSLEHLREDQDFGRHVNTAPDIYTDYVTAMRLLESDLILKQAGYGYDSAVRRCIKCNFEPRSTNLEDDEFRQAVYNGVVALLEEQVRAVLGPMSA